jgi:hypothetical protein
MDGDISLTFNDTHHHYSMDAYFNRGQTRAVEDYMDRKLGALSNMSFVNTRIDGELALDDHTTFYLKKYPGHVKINLDKDENSSDSYYRVRAMCEGLKKVLSR